MDSTATAAWPEPTRAAAYDAHPNLMQSPTPEAQRQKSKAGTQARPSATYSTKDVIARASACGLAVQAVRSANGSTAEVTTTCHEAASIADVACEQGDKESCAIAKSMHDMSGVVPLLRQVQAQKSCASSSVRDCQASCDAGDLDACVEVGSMYTEGKRVPRDIGRGVSILRSACDNGSMRACYMRGANLMALDSAAAATSLQTACESDVGPWNDVSCGVLLTMLDRGTYKPGDNDKHQLLSRLCERERSGTHTHGNTNACGRLQDNPGG
jgi:TPR repeat protein